MYLTLCIKRTDVFCPSLPFLFSTKESYSFIQHRSRWWKIWSQLLSLHGSTTWWAIMTWTFLISYHSFILILYLFIYFFARHSSVSFLCILHLFLFLSLLFFFFLFNSAFMDSKPSLRLLFVDSCDVSCIRQRLPYPRFP